jgi:hypothetical protein
MTRNYSQISPESSALQLALPYQNPYPGNVALTARIFIHFINSASHKTIQPFPRRHFHLPLLLLTHDNLRRRTKDAEPPDEGRSEFFVLLLCMRDVVELGLRMNAMTYDEFWFGDGVEIAYRRCHQASAVPYGVSLSFVGNDVHINAGRLSRRNGISTTRKRETRSVLTLIWLPLACSEFAILPSTICLISRCNRLPKSLNMVDPPERTMFYQRTPSAHM